jgi:hypothetical protein
VPACPQCAKPLDELLSVCPYCKANLDLLVEYVGQLQTGLTRAEQLTRQGELGQAVWAYLAVLEVDPDNAVARRQVGQVATAVRQFDRTAPGRRWLGRLRGEHPEDRRSFRWRGPLLLALGAGLLALAFFLGLFAGSYFADAGSATPPARPERPGPPTLAE